MQVKAYNERKCLAVSLKDAKTAIEELNKIASAFILIVIVVVWILLMEIASTSVLVFIASQLLLVVFMFGNTAKTVFEDLIFVFVVHPFDVGDRCVIDGVQVPFFTLRFKHFLPLSPPSHYSTHQDFCRWWLKR